MQDWLFTFLLAMIAPAIVALLTIHLHESPRRVRLAVANLFRRKPRTPEDRFVIVVCWLDGDPDGIDTGNVARVIRKHDDLFVLVRSARSVTVPESGDSPDRAVGELCRPLFRAFNADLAIGGVVARPTRALELWIEPRLGRGLLDVGAGTFRLDQRVELGEDFDEYLEQSILALATAAAAPAAITELKSRGLERALGNLTAQLSNLVTVGTTGHRAAFYEVLGDAYRALTIQKSSVTNLAGAVYAYDAAVMAYAESGLGNTTIKWAEVQFQLGGALMRFGDEVGGTECLQNAMRALKAARDAFDFQGMQSQSVRVQVTHSMASSKLAERMPGDHLLEEAVSEFQNLCGEFEDTFHPFERALVNQFLANALFAAAERKRSPELLPRALDAYAVALKLFGKPGLPRAFRLVPMETRSNRSCALRLIGSLEDSEEYLREAEKDCRVVIKAATAEGAPRLLADALANLGMVLCDLGDRNKDTGPLVEAVSAYHAALLEYDSLGLNESWAIAQHNLAGAYLSRAALASHTERPPLLEDMVDACRAALSRRDPERTPYDWLQSTMALGKALRSLGRAAKRPECLAEAVKLFQDAIDKTSRRDEPWLWIEGHRDLGRALQALGQHEHPTEHFRAAVQAFRTAFEEIEARESPGGRAMAQADIGGALVLAGSAADCQDTLLEARATYRAALDTLDEAGLTDLYHQVEGRLAELARSIPAMNDGTGSGLSK